MVSRTEIDRLMASRTEILRRIDGQSDRNTNKQIKTAIIVNSITVYIMSYHIILLYTNDYNVERQILRQILV